MKHLGSDDNAGLVASFRDPAGQLLAIDGRILRIVNGSGVRDLRTFLGLPSSQMFVESGKVISTQEISFDEVAGLFQLDGVKRLVDTSQGVLLLEHEQVPFQSFPYEWPPEMLHKAACLTLDLAESLLSDQLGLKDATPYNILFRGPHPVFVDVLSFEQRDAADPIWLPYAQFVRAFLLPLLVNRYLGISLDQLLSTRRDGLEPVEVYRLLGPLQRLLPPFLPLVSIPTWLTARKKRDDSTIYRKRTLGNPEKAEFILRSLFKRLRRALERLKPDEGNRSAWSDYLASNNNYSDDHFQAKHSFVEGVIRQFKPRRVLDIGCNTGHFSGMAAGGGARVVAIDSDPVVVGETWRKAYAEGLDILPLVMNLSRPSPAIGWRNRECASFLSRACGNFDAVFMLALIHHMLVSERVPLSEIIDLASELTIDILVIEFIAPSDSMFRRLTRGRDHLFKDLTPSLFEDTCRRKFEVIRSQHLENTDRWLYVLRKR